MTTSSENFVAQIDGRTATAEMLAPLAFAGYAHFTARQVRDGQMRGLDLRLERLRVLKGVRPISWSASLSPKSSSLWREAL